MSGVIFTRGLETGAPYYRINFDDHSNSTESVTAGTHLDLRTILINRHHSDRLKAIEPKLMPVLRAVRELESLLCFDKLDIEFATDQLGRVHIFQVRPITVDHSRFEVSEQAVADSIDNSIRRFQALQRPSPFILGNRTCFGNMPDWNPAEIIGTHPRPLAFSLYRTLITDEVWATQRATFGYRDVRPHPLIVSFCGQPYVDIRASLNSFIPASLPDDLAGALVDAYLERLSHHPQYHDKIEFEVAFTAWTPDFAENASQRLLPLRISETGIEDLGTALKQITAHAIERLPDDIRSIEEMNRRRQSILQCGLAPLDRAYTLLDDCRRYGTLAFAHAARAGFVATSLLNGMVQTGTLSERRRQAFMRAINTVAGEFEADKRLVAHGQKSREYLVQQYGHLRPGTYDILNQAYWEDPDRYLSSEVITHQATPTDNTVPFHFTATEADGIAAMLAVMGSKVDIAQFQRYLVDAIRQREAVKFDFTRNLSSALDACIELGAELGLSREQIAFLEFSDLEQLKVNKTEPTAVKQLVQLRQQTYSVSRLIELPHLILQEHNFYCFERHAAIPNYVTTGRVIAEVTTVDDRNTSALRGKIALIPQADPGYDWLFGQGICGLITQYGGANSHMAIRAAEMGLPAAIGVGGKLYDSISSMHSLELDCGSHVIRPIQ